MDRSWWTWLRSSRLAKKPPFQCLPPAQQKLASATCREGKKPELSRDDKHGQFKGLRPASPFTLTASICCPNSKAKKGVTASSPSTEQRDCHLAVYEAQGQKAATDFLKRCLALLPV